jgi:hypothetical protein
MSNKKYWFTLILFSVALSLITIEVRNLNYVGFFLLGTWYYIIFKNK